MGNETPAWIAMKPASIPLAYAIAQGAREDQERQVLLESERRRKESERRRKEEDWERYRRDVTSRASVLGPPAALVVTIGWVGLMFLQASLASPGPYSPPFRYHPLVG